MKAASGLVELGTLVIGSASTHYATIEQIAEAYRTALAGGHTLFFTGNGGSAADAMHCAAEYVVRFQAPRRPLAAHALGTNPALTSAAGNDLGFPVGLAREVQALMRAGDVLVVHSTSGASKNLLLAAQAAHENGALVVALLGKGGGALKQLADLVLVVDSDDTGRIQLVHMAIQHELVGLVEASLQ